MIDESSQTLNLPKKGEKKPNRDSRRTLSSARPSSAAGNLQGAPRPSSTASNKKPATGASTTGGAESGSDTNRKAPDSKKVDPRKNQSGGAQRNGSHRKGQPSTTQSTRLMKEPIGHSSSPAPPSVLESSDALSSLQRVIADLKTTSPPNQSSSPAMNNSLAASMHAPQVQPSNLPVNAPVFQPGAFSFPTSADAVRHRKAVSLGTAGGPANYNSFSPHLGAMMEDVEDGDGTSFEDGEIFEAFYPQQQGHQPRSQSQNFMAPRFAALAAAQEQEVLGPTGRPQLAPGFMFGARRRASSNVPVGPPINEEDVRFQFPQQQHNFPLDEQPQRKPDGDITGIMAEQVCINGVVCYA